MSAASLSRWRKNSVSELNNTDTQLWFPVIAGHFYGTPNATKSWQARPDEQSQFSLSLSDVQPELQKLAQPFDAKETSLLIEPEDTRIARLASFALSEFNGEPLGSVDWRNSANNKSLMLVYFDRSCRVLGSLFIGDKEHRFDLAVPSAGLYWLQKRGVALFASQRYSVATSELEPLLTLAVPD